MKKIFYCLIYIFLLILISIIPVSAKEVKTCIRTEKELKVRENLIHDDSIDDILSTPCVDDVEKIYDFANLLTDEEEDKLFKNVNSFIKSSNYDLVLVTTNENLKYNAREYADDFYDYNSFGYNQTRDGLLILIDMATSELYISTTGYAIKMYDDLRIENILDAGYDAVASNNYYDAFSKMLVEVDNYFNLDYPASNKNLLIDKNGDPYHLKYIPFPMIFIISTIVTLITSLILYFKTRLKIKVVPTTKHYVENKELNLKTDQFINSYVNKVRIPKETSYSSSSSSSRSGSSYHSSSSHSSHGGGGRKF